MDRGYGGHFRRTLDSEAANVKKPGRSRPAPSPVGRTMKGISRRGARPQGENIRIVPMAEEHIESFRVCLDAVAKERRYLALTQAPPAEAVREFIRSAIARRVPQFVALDGNQVIGWCDVFPNERDGSTHVGRLGMGLLPEYRGQGSGRRLAEKTIALAREIGLERIELDVYASNKPAIALYQSLGFAVEGVKRKGRKLDGVYDDVVVMGLLL